MTTISHTQLCAGLKISRARVDQWLSRGFITLETETMSGRVRQWTERDAIKLAALKDMADANLRLNRSRRISTSSPVGIKTPIW